LICLALDDHETAEQDFARAARLLPDRAFAQVRMARIHRAAGRTEEALRAYRAAAEAGHADAQIWAELALALEGADQLNGAVGTLRRAFQQDPANPHVAQSLSHLLMRQGNYDAALRVLATAADTASCRPDLHTLHGDAAALMWRLDEAAKAYRSAIDTSRDGHPALVRLARVHRLRREYDRALDLLHEALDDQADDTDVHAAALLERAALLTEVGRTDAALDLLQEAASLPGAGVQVTRRLVRTYLRVGTPQANEAALRHAQLAVASGDGPENMAALARALLATGSPDKALSAAGSALEKSSDCTSALRVAARAHIARENLQEAAALLDRALEANPYDVQALQLAGRVKRLAGQPQECAELWRRALELNPWDGKLHRELADVLAEQLDDRESSLRHIAHSAKLRKLRETYAGP
jgi:tetratricopeptide (TPR) repeat protein